MGPNMVSSSSYLHGFFLLANLIGGFLALPVDDEPVKNRSVGFQGLFKAIGYFDWHRAIHSYFVPQLVLHLEIQN